METLNLRIGPARIGRRRTVRRRGRRFGRQRFGASLRDVHQANAEQALSCLTGEGTDQLAMGQEMAFHGGQEIGFAGR